MWSSSPAARTKPRIDHGENGLRGVLSSWHSGGCRDTLALIVTAYEKQEIWLQGKEEKKERKKKKKKKEKKKRKEKKKKEKKELTQSQDN